MKLKITVDLDACTPDGLSKLLAALSRNIGVLVAAQKIGTTVDLAVGNSAEGRPPVHVGQAEFVGSARAAGLQPTGAN
jgi:hypothetical protein